MSNFKNFIIVVVVFCLGFFIIQGLNADDSNKKDGKPVLIAKLNPQKKSEQFDFDKLTEEEKKKILFEEALLTSNTKKDYNFKNSIHSKNLRR